jgi:signal transduction histidine kinase
VLELQAGYGYEERKHLSTSFRIGEGLVGQCAKEKKRILLTDVPSDYVRINSGLGESAPLNIIVLPSCSRARCARSIELASFSPFSVTHQAFLDSAHGEHRPRPEHDRGNTLTENLLKQSQSQAEELRSQQEELRESNEDLGRQATLLAEQNIEAERKNREVESPSDSSRRRPSSSRLVEVQVGVHREHVARAAHAAQQPADPGQQLEDNPDENMTDTQVEYASVIHSSGNELLELLNSILDLAKVESGTVTLEMTDLAVASSAASPRVRARSPEPARASAFSIDLAPDCPRRSSPTRSGCARS